GPPRGARLSRTQDELTATQAEHDRLVRLIDRIRLRFQRRAVLAFETGAAGTLDLLLSSNSFSEFSDRVEFLGNMAQADSDLVVDNRVTTEQLRRTEVHLADLSKQQADQAQQLRTSQQAISSDVSDLQAEMDRHRRQYKLDAVLAISTN